MQGFLLEADCVPIVQKGGAYFSVKLDRSIVPIENIEHNSEAVSFFHYSGKTRQQHPSNTLPTKPWSDKEVFQENTRANQTGIVPVTYPIAIVTTSADRITKLDGGLGGPSESR